MFEMQAVGRVKSAELELTIVRADGTVHNLGRVSSSKRRFNYGPARLLAARRIRKFNQTAKGN